MRVILGDDTEVSIDCACCERGYEGSPGKLSTCEYVANASSAIITGVESKLREDGSLCTRYSIGSYSAEEENVFATKAEALDRAAFLMREHQDEETKRLRYKEKRAQTWAWNVRYHRRAIKDAQRQIEYHTSKLNVAPKNVKDADKIDLTSSPQV